MVSVTPPPLTILAVLQGALEGAPDIDPLSRAVIYETNPLENADDDDAVAALEALRIQEVPREVLPLQQRNRGHQVGAGSEASEADSEADSDATEADSEADASKAD